MIDIIIIYTIRVSYRRSYYWFLDFLAGYKNNWDLICSILPKTLPSIVEVEETISICFFISSKKVSRKEVSGNNLYNINNRENYLPFVIQINSDNTSKEVIRIIVYFAFCKFSNKTVNKERILSLVKKDLFSWLLFYYFFK